MFITYKITNTITGKYYIGSHKTDNINDGYMGSGKLIRESINTYGIDCHQKEILGVFSTRKESLDLEHKLIKERKLQDRENCLNMTTGGNSFDYINENLTCDWSSYGKMANHNHNIERGKQCQKRYEESPVSCLQCGKLLPYSNRYGKFCSHSCSATYSNHRRIRHTKSRQKQFCRYCGLEISYNTKFCNNSCSSRFYGERREISPLRKRLIECKHDIQVLNNSGKSYREIAIMYNTSANTIKNLLKGRLDPDKV